MKLLVALFAALGACACSTAPATEGAFRSLERGAFSGIEERGVRVARDAAQWASLWAEHVRRQSPPPLPPSVDFESEMVLHVCAGTRPTSGWSLAVERVRMEGDVLVVEARETAPPAGAVTLAVETSPFEIVLAPRGAARVELRFAR